MSDNADRELYYVGDCGRRVYKFTDFCFDCVQDVTGLEGGRRLSLVGVVGHLLVLEANDV